MEKEIIVMPLGGVSRLAVKFKVTRKTVYEEQFGAGADATQGGAGRRRKEIRFNRKIKENI